MILIILDKRVDIDPSIPAGMTIKIASHPMQITGRAKHETFYANAATAALALGKTIIKAQELATDQHFIHYVEVDNEGDKLSARISSVVDGQVQPILAEIRRGKFFAGIKEKTIDVTGVRMDSDSAVERYMEVIEVARFIANEIR
jgi:hypothetical protein